MDIGEERLGPPPSHLHDCLRAMTGEPQGHSTRCAQRVCADTGKVVAASFKVSKAGAAPNGKQDHGRLYINPRLYIAQRGGHRHVLCHDGTDQGRNRAYWTKVGTTRLLMDGVTALSILLVIHRQRHRGGSCEGCWIAMGREQRLALPETYITDSKLDCAGDYPVMWACVFAHS